MDNCKFVIVFDMFSTYKHKMETLKNLTKKLKKFWMLLYIFFLTLSHLDLHIYSFIRHFYPKPLTNEEYKKVSNYLSKPAICLNK